MFLLASAGYAFAKLQEHRRTPEGYVCLQIVTDPSSLPDAVLAGLEGALGRGARLLVGRVDDLVTVMVQEPDGSLGDFVEYVEELEQSLPPVDGSVVIDGVTGEVIGGVA